MKKFFPFHHSLRKGFTLIEMLVYMGLFSVMFLLTTEILISVLEVRVEAQATSAVVQDGRYLLGRFSYDIQRATSISLPANIGDQTASLALVINGVTYTYALSGTTLQLTTNAGTSALTSPETQISNLSFRKLGATGSETIQILFTLKSVSRIDNKQEERSFQTTIGKR